MVQKNLRIMSNLLRDNLRALDGIAADRVLHVHYEALTADPIGIVQRIHEHFNLPWSALALAPSIPRAPRAGFEPAAYSLGGSRSIQLSYRGGCRFVALLSRVEPSHLHERRLRDHGSRALVPTGAQPGHGRPGEGERGSGAGARGRSHR